MTGEQRSSEQVQQDSDENGADAPGTEETRAEAGAEAGPAAEDGGEESLEQLKLTLQDAEAKADDYWNQLLRTRAELSNLQRRAERDLENAHKFGVEKFVRELLPVKDSLELGLNAAREQGDSGDKLLEGVELTLKMFADALEKMGVAEVNPEGEPFNPDYHQAMSMADDPQAVPNTVLTVYQKGYLLNERLVRPAMVVVAGGNSGQDTGGNGKKVDETA